MAAATALLAGQAVLATVVQSTEAGEELTGRGELLLAALAALTMLWTAFACRRRSSRLSDAWLLLGIAHVAYAFGDAFSTGLGVSLASDSLSVVMNACYLAFYPLFLLGVLRMPSARLRPQDRWRLTLDIAVVLVAAGVILWSLIIRPLAAAGKADSAAVALTATFPLGDMALLWVVLAVLLRREHGRGMLVHRLLATSAALLIVTDIAYSVQILDARVDMAPWISFGYATSHVVAALAACRHLLGLDRRALLEATTGSLTHAGNVTASLFIATAALLLAFLVHFVTHDEPAELLEGVAVVSLVVLVATRLAYEGRENRHLYRRLARARDQLEVRVQDRTAELATANRDLRQEVLERQRAEARLQQQVERLAALRSVDAAITGGGGLARTLEVLAHEVVRQLHVNAAVVLVLRTPSNRLEHVASSGLPREILPHAPSLLGACPAGRAAIERRMVGARDLAMEAAGCRLASQLLEHGFRSSLAVPLVAKGLVRGVLELIHSQPLDRDADWYEFLATLAGQAAVAIENGTLLEELQRSNVELSLAYDTTLEGWSRALELRDEETEGHTRRVADLAVLLARAVGIPDEQIVHVHRGALLHDIGKVAIPDNILLKPGPLTEDEWRTMRLHPEYAGQLLAPIPFLRPALDIPTSHHERWDGTGYPQGLSGEEIPLPARVFAVVDSWDALSHDRPYRAAWPRERILRHLQDSAGTQFDPAVVRAFLDVITE